jgi:hypothetical protein
MLPVFAANPSVPARPVPPRIPACRYPGETQRGGLLLLISFPST